MSAVAPFYRDVRVLALPETEDRLRPLAARSTGGAVRPALLSDGSFGASIAVPLASGTREASLVQDFGRSVSQFPRASRQL